MSAPVADRVVRSAAAPVNLLPRQRIVRSRRFGVSLTVDLRAGIVCLLLLAVAAGLAMVSISLGVYPVPFADVLRALAGEGDFATMLTVREFRLPRALVAILVGAAFGLSGAIFQGIARNPLASPDIIGVNAGAALFAVAAIVLAGGNRYLVVAGALVGGILTSVIVYLLAWRNGLSAYRLILVGIAVGAMSLSLVSYLVVKAEIWVASSATLWLTGSLNGRAWEHVVPLSVLMLVLVPTAAWLGRRLRMLELGEDVAAGLGVKVSSSQRALLGCAVLLASGATAAAGPIGFVALVAPQIARRMAHAPGVSLLPSACVGSVIVLGADLLGRTLFQPVELSVGLMTALVGAPYLLYLIARANKVGKGG